MKKGLVKFFILSKIKIKLIFFFFFVPDIVRQFPTWIYFDRGEHYNIIETPTTNGTCDVRETCVDFFPI
jgi:hypothetical protein